MNLLASLALVAPILVPLQEPAPAGGESSGGVSAPARVGEAQTTDGVAEPVELPEDLRAALEGIDFAVASGDLELARGILRESVAGLEEKRPLSDAVRLRVLRELDERAETLGSLEEQLSLRRSILEIRTRLLPPGHLNILAAKGNLAVTKANVGDLEGARALEEEVLEARKRLLPPEHPDLLTAKQNLAATKYDLGDLEGARALEEEVLEAQARLCPPEHPLLLLAKENLALTRRALGDFEGARALQEEVLEARTRLLPPEHPDVLRVKQNLAVTEHYLGDLEGAHALEEEVLEARKRLFPAEHPDLLRAKQSLAATKHGLGDLEGARALEEEVFEARTRLLPPEHPDLLRAKQNLAATKYSFGDLEGARALEEEVLAVRTRLLPPGHPDLLRSKESLAATKAELGDLEGARTLAESLLAGMRDRSRSLRADSRRAAREGARSELDRLFEVLLLCSACDPKGALAPAVFSTLESLRTVSVDGPEIALALADRAELARRGGRVAELRAAISDLSASPPEDADDVEAWRNRLQGLTGERDAAEYELFKGLSEMGVFVDTIDATHVARELNEGEAAVSYLRYPREVATDPETDEEPLDSFLAFVVRPDASVERIELGSAARIEDLVRQWRVELGSPVGGRGVGLETTGVPVLEPAGTGKELRRSILDPILKATGDLRHLYVCLDDALYLVPFDALPWDEERVGDHLVIHTEVSLARLVRPRRPSAAEPGMLLAGGIDYDAKPASPTSIADSIPPPVSAGGTSSARSGVGATGFLPLAEAEREVEGIAALFESSFGIEPVVLVGANATKSALAERVPRTRFLHLATHGWFAPEALRSQLDGLEGLERADETLRGFAPETLCGLALAGANLGRDAVGRVPGILTAEELSSLDLRGCELAVLSACETNVGIRRAGQGIQSLQTALHAAGARTAITSLWKVDDAATRRLMELFYTKLWSEGLGKADALWQAKKALRDEGYPVRAWAGWVLTGDPD